MKIHLFLDPINLISSFSEIIMQYLHAYRSLNLFQDGIPEDKSASFQKTLYQEDGNLF